MLPRKFFENLHVVMAILVHFEQFSDRLCVKFLTLISGCFAKYDVFCLHIFNYACLRRKAYSYRRGSKLWKNCMHQKDF